MIDYDIQLNIIKQLGDNRSKLSALFSLYNTNLLMAEQNRGELSIYYEQMIDFKNDLSNITTQIAKASKDTREQEANKNKAKVNRIDKESVKVKNNFSELTVKYRSALQECGSLKTEYKHNISELCKQFKSCIDADTPETIIKGYKNQVKVLKLILDKIEQLVADYNVKRNKVEKDSDSFNELYSSVHALVVRLQSA